MLIYELTNRQTSSQAIKWKQTGVFCAVLLCMSSARSEALPAEKALASQSPAQPALVQPTQPTAQPAAPQAQAVQPAAPAQAAQPAVPQAQATKPTLPQAQVSPPAAPQTQNAHPVVQPAAVPMFADVNGQMISARDFERALLDAQRQKFYHGKPPESEVLALNREVADRLINRILMIEEIGRRDMKPDEAAITAQIAEYDKRYANSKQWQENRAGILPGLTGKLREQNLLARLEADVRRLPEPTPAETRTYYDAHPELFTEPEKLKLASILLKVDPSSPSAAWEKAKEEAAAIRHRIVGGADFAEQAKVHSADESAAKGGDMGYVHRGMLPEGLHKHLDAMKVGDLSEPIQVLEGWVILRLDDRKLARKRDFDDVAKRASELFARERSDKVWKEFLSGLRGKANVRIDTQRYPFLKTEDAKGS